MTDVRIAKGSGQPEILAAISTLRLAAWGPLIGDEAAARRFAIDDYDETAWHFLIEVGGAAIAAGRLTVCEDLDAIPEPTSFGPHRALMIVPVGFASRLVVHPDHKGTGLARQIIEARLRLARELGLTQVWGETRERQIGGLAGHGYEVVGRSADRSVPGDWWILLAAL